MIKSLYFLLLLLLWLSPSFSLSPPASSSFLLPFSFFYSSSTPFLLPRPLKPGLHVKKKIKKKKRREFLIPQFNFPNPQVNRRYPWIFLKRNEEHFSSASSIKEPYTRHKTPYNPPNQPWPICPAWMTLETFLSYSSLFSDGSYSECSFIRRYFLPKVRYSECL